MRNICLAFICLILCTFSGCQYRAIDIQQINNANGYLPLQVGNYWELTSTDKTFPGTSRKEVTQKVTINGFDYFQIKSWWDSNLFTLVDSAYYRVDLNGYVYMLRDAKSKEVNPFRLEAKEGDRWNYGSDDFGTAEITVTRVESLEINLTRVDNCKLYAYDVPGWADEETYTYLAPGIGFVTEYSAWGFRRALKRARINGKDYAF